MALSYISIFEMGIVQGEMFRNSETLFYLL